MREKVADGRHVPLDLVERRADPARALGLPTDPDFLRAAILLAGVQVSRLRHALESVEQVEVGAR